MITQKRTNRVITGSHWNAHTDPLLAMLRILKNNEIHSRQEANFMVHCTQVLAYSLDMFNTNSAFLNSLD